MTSFFIHCRSFTSEIMDRNYLFNIYCLLVIFTYAFSHVGYCSCTVHTVGCFLFLILGNHIKGDCSSVAISKNTNHINLENVHRCVHVEAEISEGLFSSVVYFYSQAAFTAAMEISIKQYTDTYSKVMFTPSTYSESVLFYYFTVINPQLRTWKRHPLHFFHPLSTQQSWVQRCVFSFSRIFLHSELVPPTITPRTFSLHIMQFCPCVQLLLLTY